MVSSAHYWGGAIEKTITTAWTTAWAVDRRVQHITNSSIPGADVRLPDITDPHIPLGVHVFIFLNTGANRWDLVDTNGQGINEQINQDEGAIVSTYMDGSTKKWHVWVTDLL